MHSDVTASQLREVLLGAQSVFARSVGEPLQRLMKADGTVVTGVDTAINDWLRLALNALCPQAAWLSEESVDDPTRQSATWTWVVDPLDGTKELLRGVPECAVSIGLVHDGTTIAGGVMNPFDRLGAATGTDGSWLSWPENLLATAPALPAETSISRSEKEDRSIAPYLDLLGPVRSIGSVANKLLRVACGFERMTVSVQPKSEWDLSGGVALLQAKEMVLTRLDGNPLIFNQADTRIPGGFVAGAPQDVDECLRLVRGRFAQQALAKETFL